MSHLKPSLTHGKSHFSICITKEKIDGVHQKVKVRLRLAARVALLDAVAPSALGWLDDDRVAFARQECLHVAAD